MQLNLTPQGQQELDRNDAWLKMCTVFNNLMAEANCDWCGGAGHTRDKCTTKFNVDRHMKDAGVGWEYGAIKNAVCPLNQR